MTGERPPSILRRSDAMRRRIQEISGKIQMLEEKRLDLQGRLRASTWRGIHLEEQVGDLRDTIAQLKRQQAMLETLLLVAKRKEGREGEEGENRESREDRENRESRRHFEAGALFSETDRSEEAVSEYQQAVALAPSLTEAWENMGLEDLRLERYPQAHESFLRALSLNPGDASLHYNLAVLLDDRLNQPSQALLHYRLFLALAPEAPDAPEVRQRVRELEDAEDSWQ